MLQKLRVNLRLYFRNKMALLYGYLFPTIFLVAFWVLYRHEPVPLVRHVGELLTVTILGGACFGLPTAMVSERERGVWRRYRLAPVSTTHLVISVIASRYVLLVTAGGVQLALAMGIGMPFPQHALDLGLAFTVVAFSFLGLGLVIAMLADNVPAVQALGQCIFLPMLIIGGVAVRLESLPAWAQHLSAFFPGRYAVELLQVCVTGGGVGAAPFSLMALLLIGAAGCITGAKLFRWDTQERFARRSGKAWIGVALAAWIVVGVGAEWSGRVDSGMNARNEGARSGGTRAIAPLLGLDTEKGPRTSSVASGSSSAIIDSAIEEAAAETLQAAEGAIDKPEAEIRAKEDAANDRGEQADAGTAPPEPRSAAKEGASPAASSAWQAVTRRDIEHNVRFDRLPPDEGLIAPIATTRDSVAAEVAQQLQCIRANLPFWEPGQVADPVQRARNYLYVAAVPDMFRFAELEPWVPLLIFRQLQYILSKDQLIKVLYWIATHPDEGAIAASNRLGAVCIDTGGPSDIATLRERTRYYALKLLGRLTGHISSASTPAY